MQHLCFSHWNQDFLDLNRANTQDLLNVKKHEEEMPPDEGPDWKQAPPARSSNRRLFGGLHTFRASGTFWWSWHSWIFILSSRCSCCLHGFWTPQNTQQHQNTFHRLFLNNRMRCPISRNLRLVSLLSQYILLSHKPWVQKLCRFHMVLTCPLPKTCQPWLIW